ncbi:hypothetical protein [uncultured Fusobacterium sp.]|uniref:hypothetical protein n=1 Tax=uncultured Fusobacterium sp. TaxID=159267 RepID=UPI00280411DB|nr:hypothetical protein [uncultured Fusobacterium sp.]
MTKDLFFDLLEENENLTEYDLREIVNVVEEAVDEGIISEYYLEDIEFYQELINFMEENSYDSLNLRLLEEFSENF